MQYLLPGQSVSDVRFDKSDGTLLISFGPGTLVSSLSNTPSTIVWS